MWGTFFLLHNIPHIARLAQLVEQLLYTERVGGSSPSPRTKNHIAFLSQVPPRGIEPRSAA